MLGLAAPREITEYFANAGDDGVRYRLIAPPERSLSQPPLFLFGTVSRPVLHRMFAETEVGEVGCYTLDNTVIAPDGVAIRAATPLASDSFIHPMYHVTAIAARVRNDAVPVRYVPGPVCVIYGPTHITYGHWLVDFLPRLWVLDRAGYEIATIKYILPPDIAPWMLEILRLIGLSDAQFVSYDYWSELLRTDLLVMPTNLRRVDRMNPCFAEATAFWIDRVLARADLPPSPAGDRIFLSRARTTQQRTLRNRDAIEAMAVAAGFEIVFPEQLGFLQQIAMFRGARQVIGEYGSALHGSVFSRPGLVTCALRGDLPAPGYIQTGLAQVLHQQVGYVVGTAQGQDADQAFSVEETDFQDALGAMALYPVSANTACRQSLWRADRRTT